MGTSKLSGNLIKCWEVTCDGLALPKLFYSPSNAKLYGVLSNLSKACWLDHLYDLLSVQACTVGLHL